MKIHNDSEHSLASLARAYCKSSERFRKRTMHGKCDFPLFGIDNTSSS